MLQRDLKDTPPCGRFGRSRDRIGTKRHRHYKRKLGEQPRFPLLLRWLRLSFAVAAMRALVGWVEDELLLNR
jgi:hypothetical protein